MWMYVRGDDGGDWIRELWKSDMGTMNESFFFKKKNQTPSEEQIG